MNTLMPKKLSNQNSLKTILNILFVLYVMLASVSASLSTSVSAKDEPMGLRADWEAPFYQNHQLVGKVWDTHKNSWITAAQLDNEILYYDYILLGETHSNSDHHRLQAEVINSLIASGKKPSVVMEMLSIQDWKDQPHTWNSLSELQQQSSALNDGWPWELYVPILQSVVQHRLELYAGNISSSDLQQWSNKQGAFKTDDVVKEYAYTKQEFKILKKNIVDSHCGYGGEEFVKSMSRAQMQRDRIMTESILEKSLPVVFIAGSGHVRNDYAVPMQLRKKYKQSSYLSIAFISVQEDRIDPKDYLQAVSAGSAVYDILYFTPSHTNQDPCEKFRKQLKNMQHRQTP